MPLVGDRFNYWLLARTDRDHPSRAFVEKSAHAVMRKWFAEFGYLPGAGQAQIGGHKIDSFEVLGASQKRFPGPDFSRSGLEKVADWRSCPEPQSVVEDNRVWSVSVRFVPRVDEVSIEWPAYREGIWKTRRGLDADWLLLRAWVDRRSDAPPEQFFFDELERRAVRGSNLALGLAGLAGLGALVLWTRPWR